MSLHPHSCLKHVWGLPPWALIFLFDQKLKLYESIHIHINIFTQAHFSNCGTSPESPFTFFKFCSPHILLFHLRQTYKVRLPQNTQVNNLADKAHLCNLTCHHSYKNTTPPMRPHYSTLCQTARTCFVQWTHQYFRQAEKKNFLRIKDHCPIPALLPLTLSLFIPKSPTRPQQAPCQISLGHWAWEFTHSKTEVQFCSKIERSHSCCCTSQSLPLFRPSEWERG